MKTWILSLAVISLCAGAHAGSSTLNEQAKSSFKEVEEKTSDLADKAEKEVSAAADKTEKKAKELGDTIKDKAKEAKKDKKLNG